MRWARKAMQENAHWIACHRQLIGALELNGLHQDANAAARKHIELAPQFSVSNWIEPAHSAEHLTRSGSLRHCARPASPNERATSPSSPTTM